MGLLDDIVGGLTDIRDSVKKWTDARTASAQRAVFGGDGKDPLFNSSILQDIKKNQDLFKARLDPRNRNPATNVNELGYSDGVFTSDTNYFTALPTMDVWKVQLQANTLRGLIGGRTPTIPMVFNILFPISAQNLTAPDPLYLFVNPQSWSRSNNKIQTNQYVRNGIKTERWGDELEQISANGTIGAFFTLETGLTRFFRRQTPSYRNLMKLLQLFKNNGSTYNTDYQGSVPSGNKRPTDIGQVEILYDKELFRGTFDTFTIREVADKPFQLEYSFTFVVEESVHISEINPTSTQVASQVSSGGSGRVQLAPGQSFGPGGDVNQSPFADSRTQTLANISQRAEASQIQNGLNTVNKSNPEKGYQPGAAPSATLLKELTKK